MMEIRSLTSIGSAEGKGFELTHVTAMLPVADYVRRAAGLVRRPFDCVYAAVRLYLRIVNLYALLV